FGLPLVAVDVECRLCHFGWDVQRLETEALSADQTAQGCALQSVLPEWKFHRLSFASATRASASGAVVQVMKDRAVRGVPLAFLVPGLPKSNSVSVDQSRASPCWT